MTIKTETTMTSTRRNAPRHLEFPVILITREKRTARRKWTRHEFACIQTRLVFLPDCGISSDLHVMEVDGSRAKTDRAANRCSSNTASAQPTNNPDHRNPSVCDVCPVHCLLQTAQAPLKPRRAISAALARRCWIRATTLQAERISSRCRLVLNVNVWTKRLYADNIIPSQ